MKAVAPIIVCVLALVFIWTLDKCKPKTDSTPQLTVENSTQTQSESPDTVFVNRVDTLFLYKTKYVQKWNYDNPNFIVQHDTVFCDTGSVKIDTLIHHVISELNAPVSDDSDLNTFTGKDSTETYTMSWEMGIHGDLIYFEPVIRVYPIEKKCRFWDLFKRKK